jgi:hypothetical protein
MRLTSWNLLHGQVVSDQGAPAGESPHSRATDLSGVENLKELAADLKFAPGDFILGVQEVDANQPRSSGISQVDVLAKLLDANDFGYLRCVIGTPGVAWRKLQKNEERLITNSSPTPSHAQSLQPSYGIGLITNIEVLNWQVLSLGKSPIGLPLAFPTDDAKRGSRKKRLRLIYIKDEPRFALAAQLANGYTVANAHLSFVPIINLIQLWRLKRWLAKMPGEHILLGDLNLPFGIPTIFSKWQSLASAPTYPSWNPKLKFDYILSKNLINKKLSQIDLESKFSDHLPVTIEIN